MVDNRAVIHRASLSLVGQQNSQPIVQHQRNHSTPLAFKTSSSKRHSHVDQTPNIEAILPKDTKSLSSSPSLHSIPAHSTSPAPTRQHRKTKSNITDSVNNKKSFKEEDEEEEEASSVIIHSDSSSDLDDDQEDYLSNEEDEEENNRQKLLLIEFDSSSDENILMSRINPISDSPAASESLLQEQQPIVKGHKKSSSTYLKKLINDSGAQSVNTSPNNLPTPSILAMSGSNESLKNNNSQHMNPPPPYTSSLVSGEVVNTTGSVKDLAPTHLQDNSVIHSASSPLLQVKHSSASLLDDTSKHSALFAVPVEQIYDDAYEDSGQENEYNEENGINSSIESPYRRESAMVFDFSNSQENNKLSQSSESAKQNDVPQPTSPTIDKSKQGKTSSSAQPTTTTKTKRPWYTIINESDRYQTLDYTMTLKRKRPDNYVNDLSETKLFMAFMNSYKQKNDDFHKLFRLPPEDRLLVDYSCALQREILAHGRLYLSLKHLCFRANIVGWETTLVIKLKDIKSILKDRTVKIIPNAISVVLDNERYFFTSFVARDKTFATLFRVWKTALEETSLSNKEIGEMLRACYGDDLGYSVTDAEYELYGRIEPKDDQVKASKIDGATPSGGDIERENSDKKKNKRGKGKKEKESRSKSKDNGKPSTATADPATTNSFSDDQLSMNGSSQGNQLTSNSNLQLSASQSFSPVLSRPGSAQSGHQKCSSYDAAMINYNDSSLNQSNDQRPKSMLETNPINGSIENMGNTVSDSPLLSSRPVGSRSASSSKKLTSSPIERNDQQESTSSSEEPDSIEEQPPPPPPIVISNKPVKCSCERHNDKLMLNQTFNVSVNYMWECIFGHTEFCRKYWESRKFSNTKVGDWKLVDQCPYRLLEYNVDLGGMLGKPKNSEEQKIIEYKPNQCIVIESYSVTHGVPYADYFKVHNKFCITRESATSSRLHITSQLNYLKSPSFLIKGFIESNSMKALKDSFMYLASLVSREFMNEAHEATTIYCHKSTAPLITVCLRNAVANGLLDDHTASSKFHILDEHDEDKNLKQEVMPKSQAAHVSAVDNANIRNTPFFRSLQPVSSSSSRRNQAPTTSSPSTTENRLQSSTRNPADSTRQQGDGPAILINNNGEESSLRQRASRSGATARQSSHQSDAENRLNTVQTSSVAIENTDQSASGGSATTAQQQVVQTQLVPIQKFSFFKWEINVDTLVRLFIVAMIFLMVINGMLYYKLRRIESLADNIRNDPNLMLKISSTKRQFDQAIIESHTNPTSNANREITSWRSAISNTLDAIEKMEISLRQWDKNLELRQQQQQISMQNLAVDNTGSGGSSSSDSMPQT